MYEILNEKDQESILNGDKYLEEKEMDSVYYSFAIVFSIIAFFTIYYFFLN